MDCTGSDRDRQMILEELRNLAVGEALSSQSADHVRVRFQFGPRRLFRDLLQQLIDT